MPALIEFVEFFLYIEDGIAKFPIFFKGVYGLRQPINARTVARVIF